ncbi:MAG: ATP-dependent DNA ligase [Candidatus Aenigmarchaeota archaeon]|nr:ATP-dependent DNA ligase [Candidatus Aenigmarchaeota archaeon]
MDYSKLAEVYEKLEGTTKKLEKTAILAEFIKGIDDDYELRIVMALLQGKIYHESEEMEVGVASKIVVSALQKLGFSKKAILDILKETGDLGLTAEKLVREKKQMSLLKRTLNIEKVYDSLRELATLTGKNSQGKKQNVMIELLNFAEGSEAKYIIRTVLEELRLGTAEGILRDSIAKAYEIPSETVEGAYNLKTDFGEVAVIAKNEGSEGLLKAELEIGKPIRVMLAEKSESLEKALESAEDPAIEVKYDGLRTLIEKDGKKIWVFTRRLENVTKQFPDLVKLARENILAEKAIVEGETIGLREGKPLPFQELSKRIHRKYEIRDTSKEIPIQANLFDCLLIGDREIMMLPFRERRAELEKIINVVPGKFQLAEQIVTKDLKKAEKFYKNALELGQEGVMVKNLSKPYQPGKRVGNMYKVKPEKETLDVAITGAEWGEGRRAQWLGSFTLSIRDPETGDLLEIGKLGTGLTDEQFREATEILKPLIELEKDNSVRLRPKIVIEVGYQEIQKSPNYKSGFALRFPKLVRFRDDKSIDDVDSLERVEGLFRKGA